jgi:GNAT superfamily N-acetyltransferase
MAGVLRESPAKHAHKAFMWGVYVEPEHRSQGLGKQLVRSAIQQVSRLPGVGLLCTSVFLSAPEARAIYLRCGSTSWGVEPRSAKVGGEYIAEEHLVLELSSVRTNAT